MEHAREGGHEEQAGPPGPAAILPGLSKEQQGVLRQIGDSWAGLVAEPQVWRAALPVDPDVGRFPERADIAPSRFLRVVPLAPLRSRRPGNHAEQRAGLLPGDRGSAVRRRLLGAPLKSSAFVTERMRKLTALPVLSADALSSVAYGPEALLAALLLAGTAGARYVLPVAGVIVALMIAVGLSYRETIRAYPHGGGSYIVAGDNLGQTAGLVAAAGLMTDYVLTVAVSIASGVAAITSAVPSLARWTVELGVAVVLLLLAGNLRGIRQAGTLFAAPTYAFIAAMGALIATGLVDAAGRGQQPLAPSTSPTVPLGALLVIRAFSSGATAMTGIEAISNAVPVFRRVEWRNARKTLSWMMVILITMFAGIITLTHLTGVRSHAQETILSQLAHRSFGDSGMYVFVQAATAAVLLLAANTAYNDFPRVLSLLARDNYAPKVFLRLGDRLAYSNSILLLSAAAVLVYVAFNGRTAALIPLYAVGVFLAFTLSQTGMVVHWWRRRSRGWRRRMVTNGTGATLSGIVLLASAIGKFTAGAWVSLVAVGCFLTTTRRIEAHYAAARDALRLRPLTAALPGSLPEGPLGPCFPAPKARPPAPDQEDEEGPEEIRHLCVVAVATMDLAAMRTLAYAASLGQPVLTVHISTTEEEAERFRTYWDEWGDHLPLYVVFSPYRAVVAPLVHYIETLHHSSPGLTLTVLLPEVITRNRRHQFLHHRTATSLRRALRHLPRIVITTVPFHL